MSAFWMSREQVRELDRRASGEFGVHSIVLMENAGRGCAELLMRLNPSRKPAAILCGPGNNGGDGYVMARHLDNRGWPVQVFAIEAPKREKPNAKGEGPEAEHTGWSFDGLPPDAKANYEIVSRSRLEIFPLSRHTLFTSSRDFLTQRLVNTECWIVDALFGTGLSRALGSPYDELVSIVNASQNPVLAVDIPSGLDCDTGEPLGPTVRAAHTATFVAEKLGFLNPASRQWTGEVHIVDIGAPRVLVEEYRQLGVRTGK